MLAYRAQTQRKHCGWLLHGLDYLRPGRDRHGVEQVVADQAVSSLIQDLTGLHVDKMTQGSKTLLTRGILHLRNTHQRPLAKGTDTVPLQLHLVCTGAPAAC